ncbi:glycosyltransferase [Alkanindiges sp. WGS2144]|uniref:glycosyltransferase n=1 Tax=Alkanindiges sp. WGS2144 TaxID=3366808 RepID=UPI00375176D8
MPKKILFIIDHLGCGGAEKVTIELANYMAQQGEEVTLAVLNGKKNYFTTPSTIHYVDLGFSDFFAFGKLWKDRHLTTQEQQTLQQLLSQQFDLIIPQYNNGHWLRPYLSGNVWHWIHGDLIEKRPTQNLIKKVKEFFRVIRYTRKFIQLLDGANIITVSQHLTDKYFPLLRNSKLITIYNGVDQQKLYQSLNEVQVNQHWDVVFVGRVHKIKQVDHALMAFAKSGLTGRMAIIGDGPERDMVQRLINQLKLDDRVDMIGKVNNPAPYVVNAKCLVSSSFAEGTPMCIAEALSLGIPVVAYACSSGIQEQLSAPHLQQGLVPPQDQQALANRLYDVVNHPYCITDEDKQRMSMHSMYLNFMQLTG